MVPKDYPENSVNNCLSTPRNISEERRSLTLILCEEWDIYLDTRFCLNTKILIFSNVLMLPAGHELVAATCPIHKYNRT